MNNRNFRPAFSLAEAYPATVVAAILAAKTLRTGMFLGAPIRCLRNVHFTLQSGNCYKGHGWSPNGLIPYRAIAAVIVFAHNRLVINIQIVVGFVFRRNGKLNSFSQ